MGRLNRFTLINLALCLLVVTLGCDDPPASRSNATGDSTADLDAARADAFASVTATPRAPTPTASSTPSPTVTPSPTATLTPTPVPPTATEMPPPEVPTEAAYIPPAQEEIEEPVPPVEQPPHSGASWEAAVCSLAWSCQEALSVIYAESGGDPWATNPSSGACGLFQLLPCPGYDIATQLAHAWAKYVDGGHSFWKHWWQWH
jgi:hypothetical protein